MQSPRRGPLLPAFRGPCLRVGWAQPRAVQKRLNRSRRRFGYIISYHGWLGSRVVSVLDSGAEGPGFKSQSRRCRVTVLGKLFTPIVRLFTKQQN